MEHDSGCFPNHAQTGALRPATPVSKKAGARVSVTLHLGHRAAGQYASGGVVVAPDVSAPRIDMCRRFET
jgi:hypothetical protein